MRPATQTVKQLEDELAPLRILRAEVRSLVQWVEEHATIVDEDPRTAARFFRQQLQKLGELAALGAPDQCIKCGGRFDATERLHLPVCPKCQPLGRML